VRPPDAAAAAPTRSPTTVPGPGPLDAALAFLDSHVNFEKAPERRRAPTLERMVSLCSLLGDPQLSYPIIHLTGTNGKGSTARLVAALLSSHGLSVGVYTSPHLERINERMAWNTEAIDDCTLADQLLTLAPLEEHIGIPLTHFELLTAAALSWFADIAVDVAVLEVGLGGRWDSTNVADGAVAVVTNVGLDHTEVIGPTRAEIAQEKAGIVKPGATLVLGETAPALASPFLARCPGQIWRRDEDFGVRASRVAHGGRVLDLWAPGARLSEVFLPLYGAHQADNAAASLAAAQGFFGARTLDADVATEALAAVCVPGRCEVMRREPLVLLDGAHNPDGARALRVTLAEDFGGLVPDVYVVGFTGEKDPAEMLTALGVQPGLRSSRVVCCRPPHPRGLVPDTVAEAARSLGLEAVVVEDVAEAVRVALGSAGDDDCVLVTGSLYVVGEARSALTA